MSPEAFRSGEDGARGDSFRRALVAAIPRWYSPWGHLAGSIAVGVVAWVLALWGIEKLRALELVTIPIVFVALNFAEWFIHRHVMHRRRFPLYVLYDRHTPEHHRVFRRESMAIESALELRLILIPAAGVLGIVLLSVPLALGVGYLVSPNSGWLMLLTTALYVVGYELSHLLYHLPEGSFVYRVPLMRALREHHARHHEPRWMQRYNFNVTIPLGDLLFGTRAPRESTTMAANERSAFP